MNHFNPTAHRRRLLSLLMAGLCTAATAQAEDALFTLGTVAVTASKPALGEIGGDQAASVVTREDMLKYNRDNVADAVNLLSGVTLTNNARNEKMIYVRGYDVRQVPLFIDGIPVYVPYDGYVDFTRFTTADLAAIQVAKGFSSIAYGPNALGGAINLISRKPQRALEADARIGFASGNEKQAQVNVGTNQGSWYLQAGLSYVDADYFPLSDDFKATSRENGGHRENSYRTDSKGSIKFGLIPNATDEYSISYIKQEGEKGNPPSTDPTVTAKYWQWPYWNKESVYFVSKTALGDKETLKVRLYSDQFDNSLHMYTNSDYTTLTNAVSGISIYNDKTYGGSLELTTTRLANHEIKLVSHYKVDKHQAKDGAAAITESFKDTLVSHGIEDNIRLADTLQLSLGLVQHSLTPDTVYKPGSPFSLPSKKSATNGQGGLFYDYSDSARFYATIAEKTRLPTLKDRYSAKFSTYIENPGLRPEESTNYEIGYQGTPWFGAKASAAVFYNDISDKIQTVYQPGKSTCTTTAKCQTTNVGKVHITGLEVGLTTPVNRWLEVGGNYTYLDLENVSNPGTKLTDIPREKLVLHATVHPTALVQVIAFIESDSGRWASNTVKLGGFTTLNLKASYAPRPDLTLEAGINNLSDQNYSLADGYPSPGRTWFANANYRF